MFVIICTPKKCAQHQLEFLMPFFPLPRPPHLQKHCPLPFYHCKLFPFIIFPYFSVFLGIFFPLSKVCVPFTCKFFAFSHHFGSFSGFSPFPCMFLCSALQMADPTMFLGTFLGLPGAWELLCCPSLAFCPFLCMLPYSALTSDATAQLS